MTVHFVILGEPEVWSRPRVSRRGEHVIMFDPKLKLRKSIGLSIKPFFKQPFEGPIKIEVAYFCAVKDKKKWGKHKTSRPDLDNYIKNTLDSLNLIAYKDDSQICSVTAQKIWTEWPSTHVWITPL